MPQLVALLAFGEEGWEEAQKGASAALENLARSGVDHNDEQPAHLKAPPLPCRVEEALERTRVQCM